jgi:hypothetical protein
MRNRRGAILKTTTGVLLVLLPLALEVVGCNGGVQPVGWGELGSGNKPKQQSKPARQDSKEATLRIVAMRNREIAQTLNANDIIRIMQRVGFSDQQVVDLGPDLYSALRLSGAANVYYGKSLEMIMAVNNQQVQIQSSARGTFFYDLTKGRFVVGSTQADRNP